MNRRPVSTLLPAVLLVFLSVLPVAAQEGVAAKGPAAPPADFEATWTAFQREHLASAGREGAVGSAAMFLRGGAVLGESYQGFADLETGTGVDGETIFHWASCTKTLTGIAIMQLRDRGKLSLDDPIVEYLPELRQVHNPYGPMDAITLRHLMSHSAGFRAGTWPWQDEEKSWQDQPRHWSQIVAMLPYTEVLFEPGSKYSYSNPAIIFLGRVIEILSGDDFEVYVDKNILRPLGMHDAFFDNTPYHLEKKRSHVYRNIDGQLEDLGGDFNSGITVSNGGLNASLNDMAKYLRFLIGDSNEPRYEALLKRSSLDEMWRPLHKSAEQDGIVDHMGLTFFSKQVGDVIYKGHTGSQFGYTSFFYVDPERGTACIAAFNTLTLVKNEDGKLALHPERTFSKLRTLFFDSVFPALRHALPPG